jgi:chromosomal replication initiator protein
MLIKKDGSLEETHMDKLQENIAAISNIKINNDFGCVRMKAIIQLYQHSRDLMNISLRLCREAGVETLKAPNNCCLDIEFIIEHVNKFFGVDVRTANRKREIVQARQTFHFLAKMFTRFSLKDIGGFVLGYDHTTILHSIQTVKDLMETDMIYYDQVNTLIDFFSEKLAEKNQEQQNILTSAN